jgi:formylglycine-generating enzyme required for sulfatase activity
MNGSEALLERELVDLIWRALGPMKGARSLAGRFLQEVAGARPAGRARRGCTAFSRMPASASSWPGATWRKNTRPRWTLFCTTGWATTSGKSGAPGGRLPSIKGEARPTAWWSGLPPWAIRLRSASRRWRWPGWRFLTWHADRRLPKTVQGLQQAILPALAATRRVAAAAPPPGPGVGEMGDPRLQPLDPPMLRVAGGPFWMGSRPQDVEGLKKQDAQVWDDEQPGHTVALAEFSIGLHPVTNAEFAAFMKEDGYQRPELWSAEGWRWRRGQREADLTAYPEEVRENAQKWLARRPLERRGGPFFLDEPRWNAPTLPLVGVCWFEAEAYCRWLSQAAGHPYRLPSEAEWEKAARGADGRLWPWGNDWDAERCNTREAQAAVEATTPVGIYLDGASPCGALDMIGNVWEWCADWYAEDEYARRAGGAVVDPSGPAGGKARVVRGGSWFNLRYDARCACRYRGGPDLFYKSLGFRLALSPNRS